MKRDRSAFWFVMPATLHLLIFALGPILVAVILSLFQVNLLQGHAKFSGLDNVRRIFEDGAFLNALKNSAVYTVLSVPIGLAVALAVALLVAQKIRGITIFRTIFYLPAICSQVAIAMIWIYIFLPKKGMINATLGFFGLPNETDFLSTPSFAMLALVFMSIWTALGPRMVLFLAGLLNIPQSLYEAAQLDGASPAQSFWRITLPLLAPTTFFVALTAMIGSMQVFTPVYMMTKGGPDGATDVVGYHIYSAAWERFQIGEASAMSCILFAVIVLLSLLPFRTIRRQTEGVLE